MKSFQITFIYQMLKYSIFNPIRKYGKIFGKLAKIFEISIKFSYRRVTKRSPNSPAWPVFHSELKNSEQNSYSEFSKFEIQNGADQNPFLIENFTPNGQIKFHFWHENRSFWFENDTFELRKIKYVMFTWIYIQASNFGSSTPIIIIFLDLKFHEFWWKSPKHENDKNWENPSACTPLIINLE